MASVTLSVSARKVLVHKLPPLLSREEFLAQLPEPWAAAPPSEARAMRGPAADSDPHRFILLLYVPGCISKERGVVEFSRAYLVMRSAIAVKWFGDAVQGAQFKTENEPAARDAFGRSVKSAGFARLKATHASVELAPCSRLPSRKVNHADGKGKRRGRKSRRGRASKSGEASVEVALEANAHFQNFLKEEAASANETTPSRSSGSGAGQKGMPPDQGSKSKDATWRQTVSVSSSPGVVAPAVQSHLVAAILARRAEELRLQEARRNRARRSRGKESSRSSRKRDSRRSKGEGSRHGGKSATKSGRGSGNSGGKSRRRKASGRDNGESRKRRDQDGDPTRILKKGKKTKSKKNKRRKKVTADDGWTTVQPSAKGSQKPKAAKGEDGVAGRGGKRKKKPKGRRRNPGSVSSTA